MIRLVLIVIFLVIFFLFSIPMFGIEWIIGKINKRAKDISSLRIVQWAFKVILFLSGVRTKVIGLENIPKDEPVLFVGNHKSNFDIIISYAKMPNLTGFVAKKEIEKIPLLRTWMRYLYCLFLDRKNIKEGLKTILKGIDQIKHGISMVIFPEGSRNSFEDGMRPFKEGSLKLAEKSGCKIIPMVQNNTQEIMETHSPRIKRTRTVLEFGEPIDLKELSAEDRKFAGAYIQKIIEAKYMENKKLL
ncbi:MAG: lysophospholipid acyltransferase family protein [Butyrivibrio sp.]|nr:lysophospholipid acyltransferase family protein [Butyrivibrio sp.]